MGYEWKKIYKSICRNDSSQNGTVSRQAFKEACSSASVGLSNDEVRKIGQLFAPADGNTDHIDYIRMSKELNLHYGSLTYAGQQASTVNNLKEIIARQGKPDLKQLNYQELRGMIQSYQSKLDTEKQPSANERQKRQASRDEQ